MKKQEQLLKSGVQLPVGVEMQYIPELEFPRKLEDAVVSVYSGDNEIEQFETYKFEVELLAPNVVKIKGRHCTRVIYNAIIDVQFLKCYDE